jgi:hypothetical protein
MEAVDGDDDVIISGNDGENFRMISIATVNTYEKCYNKTPIEHMKLNTITVQWPI